MVVSGDPAVYRLLLDGGGGVWGHVMTTPDPRIDTLDRWRQKTDVEIAKIHKTLYGNGEPGMDEMIRVLYNDYLKREKEKEEVQHDNKDEVRKYVFWFVTFVLAMLLNSWVTEYIAEHIK